MVPSSRDPSNLHVQAATVGHLQRRRSGGKADGPEPLYNSIWVVPSIQWAYHKILLTVTLGLLSPNVVFMTEIEIIAFVATRDPVGGAYNADPHPL